jgi:hypothetical protein
MQISPRSKPSFRRILEARSRGRLLRKDTQCLGAGRKVSSASTLPWCRLDHGGAADHQKSACPPCVQADSERRQIPPYVRSLESRARPHKIRGTRRLHGFPRDARVAIGSEQRLHRHGAVRRLVRKDFLLRHPCASSAGPRLFVRARGSAWPRPPLSQAVRPHPPFATPSHRPHHRHKGLP